MKNEYEVEVTLKLKGKVNLPSPNETEETVEKFFSDELKKLRIRLDKSEINVKKFALTKDLKGEKRLFENIQKELSEGQTIYGIFRRTYGKWENYPGVQELNVLTLKKDASGNVKYMEIEAEDGGCGSFTIGASYSEYKGNNEFEGDPYVLKVTNWNI